MYNELISELDAIRREGNNMLFIAKRSTQAAGESLKKLKDHIAKVPFKSEPEEIRFFKEIKPGFHSYLVYWTAVLGIELRRPLFIQTASKNSVEFSG
jgi:hypothetical protein